MIYLPVCLISSLGLLVWHVSFFIVIAIREKDYHLHFSHLSAVPRVETPNVSLRVLDLSNLSSSLVD